MFRDDVGAERMRRMKTAFKFAAGAVVIAIVVQLVYAAQTRGISPGYAIVGLLALWAAYEIWSRMQR